MEGFIKVVQQKNNRTCKTSILQKTSNIIKKAIFIFR